GVDRDVRRLTGPGPRRPGADPRARVAGRWSMEHPHPDRAARVTGGGGVGPLHHHAARYPGDVARLRGDHRPVQAVDPCDALEQLAHQMGGCGSPRIACHSRCGVSGMSTCRSPYGRSASSTALTTAGGEPTVADSPTPLAPIGWWGEGVTVNP